MAPCGTWSRSWTGYAACTRKTRWRSRCAYGTSLASSKTSAAMRVMLTRGMTAPRETQSLVRFAHGIVIRTRRAPKSMTRAASSSTVMTRPRPYLSCVTWSCSANCSAGGAGGAAAKGLVGRWRRPAARAGFIITSMRPRTSSLQRLGDPLPAACLVVHRARQEGSCRVGQFGDNPDQLAVKIVGPALLLVCPARDDRHDRAIRAGQPHDDVAVVVQAGHRDIPGANDLGTSSFATHTSVTSLSPPALWSRRYRRAGPAPHRRCVPGWWARATGGGPGRGSGCGGRPSP